MYEWFALARPGAADDYSLENISQNQIISFHFTCLLFVALWRFLISTYLHNYYSYY